jgi:trans-2,3-dihydro-3-hydroxyanthranilate isomerase
LREGDLVDLATRTPRPTEAGASRTPHIDFFFVDVFAEEPLTGNPLTLVPDADELTDKQMRSIAREFNQSETTFLMQPRTSRATWRLRSFTPAGHEVLGAGHNALGAWLWLDAAGELQPGRELTLTQEIGDSHLSVDLTRSPGRPTSVSMAQSPPAFGRIAEDAAGLAAALALPGAALADGTDPQVVSTGVGHLMVPVRTKEDVDLAAPISSELAGILRDLDGEGCYVYTTDVAADEGDVTAYSRFFNPTVGITEDPATGTAAGPLIASLVRAGQAPEAVGCIVEQGVLLGRRSRIRVTVTGDEVRLTGSGLVVGRGQLLV